MENKNIETNKKCGFVAILGNVNAGKSSLMNSLISYKSSIVTHKRHTTNQCTRGILTIGDTQIVFIDTPGYAAPAETNEKYTQQAKIGIQQSDMIVVVIDSSHKLNDQVLAILDSIRMVEKPKVLVLNKVDLVPKPTLLPMIDQISKYMDCHEVFLTSVVRNIGIDELRQGLMSFMNPGTHCYTEDQKTDMSLNRWAAEITRESLLLFLHKEIPYQVAVVPENWLEDDKNIVITQTIMVPKVSHRQILLGAGGQKIKIIGTRTRQQISDYLKKDVAVYLHVKVRARQR